MSAASSAGTPEKGEVALRVPTPAKVRLKLSEWGLPVNPENVARYLAKAQVFKRVRKEHLLDDDWSTQAAHDCSHLCSQIYQTGRSVNKHV